MDRLRAMRQRDWSRVFGYLCVAVGLGLSVAGYAGAQWDALLLLLGALMLQRAAVEQPSSSRAAGLVRAGRVILFMFAFAAVNRAQSGVEGAVHAALGNWILWAVAALLLALPVFRKLPWRGADGTGIEAGMIFLSAVAFWLLFHWLEGTGDMADLRTLVALAATVTAAPIWRMRGQPVTAGLAFALMLVCVVVTPGEAVWPVALAVLPAGIVAGWLRR